MITFSMSSIYKVPEDYLEKFTKDEIDEKLALNNNEVPIHRTVWTPCHNIHNRIYILDKR